MINLDNVPFTKVTMAVGYLELIESQFIIEQSKRKERLLEIKQFKN